MAGFKVDDVTWMLQGKDPSTGRWEILGPQFVGRSAAFTSLLVAKDKIGDGQVRLLVSGAAEAYRQGWRGRRAHQLREWEGEEVAKPKQVCRHKK